MSVKENVNIYDEIEKIQLMKEKEELIDLVRFLCETWVEIDAFVCENCTGEQLVKYPVIQGTTNQVLFKRVAAQPYSPSSLRPAIKLILDRGGVDK